MKKMAYLNANIPPIECYIRGNYLRDQKDGHDDLYWCYVFGVCSITDRVPMFHCLMEDGGIFWRMPISAFCSKEGVPEQSIYDLVLWDSFSYHVSVTSFDIFTNKRMKFVSRDREEYYGKYLFTLDWAHSDPNTIDTTYSESPTQSKCGHVIELDNGNYAIQPNNRVQTFDPSFTVKSELYPDKLVQRKINTHLWTVEDHPKWITEDSENYHYKYKEE